jgi:hypothetical protein
MYELTRKDYLTCSSHYTSRAGRSSPDEHYFLIVNVTMYEIIMLFQDFTRVISRETSHVRTASGLARPFRFVAFFPSRHCQEAIETAQQRHISISATPRSRHCSTQYQESSFSN